MPSPFAAAIKAAGATHDKVMGDAFEYRPMTRPSDVNKRQTADPDRVVVTITGVFGNPSARAFSGPVATIGVTTERPGYASDRPFLSIRADVLPYPPRVGDRVFNPATDELYQVAEVLPSTPGYLRLDLNRIKKV